jgi:hypothetical protein
LDSDRLNRWLTLGANFGVIAGILFLGYEIRQNNESLDAESRLNHAMLRVDFSTLLAVDSGLPAIIVKAQANQELDDLEAYRLQRFYMRMFIAWQWEWGEHELGRIEAPISAWRAAMRSDSDSTLMLYPGVRETWEASKSTFKPDFVQFIDEEVIE